MRVATTGGLMQQPSSNYYLATYGLSAEAGTDTGSFLTRLTYIERPEFRDAGYADKDYGWFALVGTKLTKAPTHGLYAFFGVGRMAGYVETDQAKNKTAGNLRRTFGVYGPTAALEYVAHWGRYDIGVGHRTLIGYVDNTELKSLVAWPYNFFEFHLGVTL